jgi:hypothetical protein
MLLISGLFLLALGLFCGAFLIVLALASAAALVMQGSAVIETKGDSFSLWYVLVLGFVLGAAGLTSHRKDAAA